ncbi:MAG: hypothetical protein ACRCTR_05460 [Actinomycetota bacterium]
MRSPHQTPPATTASTEVTNGTTQLAPADPSSWTPPNRPDHDGDPSPTEIAAQARRIARELSALRESLDSTDSDGRLRALAYRFDDAARTCTRAADDLTRAG